MADSKTGHSVMQGCRCKVCEALFFVVSELYSVLCTLWRRYDRFDTACCQHGSGLQLLGHIVLYSTSMDVCTWCGCCWCNAQHFFPAPVAQRTCMRCTIALLCNSWGRWHCVLSDTLLPCCRCNVHSVLFARWQSIWASTLLYSPGMDVCTRVIVRWLLSCETRSVSSAGWRRSGRCEWACVRHGARLRFCDILVYFVHAVIASCRRLSSAVVVSRRTAAHNTQCRLHRTLAGLPVPRFVSAVFLKYNTDVSHCTCNQFLILVIFDRSDAERACYTHTPFNGPFSGTTQVSRYWYQKGKTNLDFSAARDSEWQ